ncbi:hypothetical protein ASG47_06120 [Devosia sp. Leaf420]|uniref:molybdopterin-dependent oxidoreductase n=1 Tax=Devosia sp. Leaf420 TaxID=1736374 RepID=UPI000712904C|nr:molybdopterin-dependent oxidoreductase [Devosia sp. Leaf420]KQT47960.1 hypothetical protein ASG47_06120 [Devosia sp. Leaf420]
MLRLASSLALILIATAPSWAGELAKPAAEPILKVQGAITTMNDGETAAFDLSMLDALPQHTIKATTPWYDGEHEFSGVVIGDLLETLGASGESVTVTALNDYSAEIPMEDIKDYPVILATRVDGEELSVRDKGPLFVIYPFDEHPDLYNEVIFSRSVWQVASLTVH